MKILDPVDLVLSGRRLIEASAGTGKTFNITKLYLRCLLEKELEVQSILVMTFTEAATQEIRQRIAESIAQAIDDWWDTSDPFIANLQKNIDLAQGYARLQSAKMHIDEASIFTIHGFCKRLLSLYSSSFSYHPNSELVTDIPVLYAQLLADEIIGWRLESSLFEEMERDGLITPEKIHDRFNELLYKHIEVNCVQVENIANDLSSESAIAWTKACSTRLLIIQFIQDNTAEFFDGLTRTPKNEKLITEQLQEICDWLSADENQIMLQNKREFNASVFNSNNAKAEKSLLHPNFITVFSSRKSKYSSDFQPAVNLIGKLLRVAICAGLKQNSSLVINQINKVQLLQQLTPKIIALKSKLKAYLNQHQQITFDYMIEKVAEKLIALPKEHSLLQSIRGQYPVAMLDEFQDTDNLQFSIFDKIYPQDHKQSCLVMIGDPKQAIYAFRGGDIYTYLTAKNTANECLNMTVNWRSSYAMVAAVNALFSHTDNIFGKQIPFIKVQASDQAKAQKLVLTNKASKQPTDESLHFAIAEHDSVATSENTEYFQRVSLIKWMASEITQLLETHQLCDAQSDSIEAIKAKDIAILVRTGFEAKFIASELAKYHLKTVYLSESSSIFETKQAKKLYFALDAILHHNDMKKVRVGLSSGLLNFQNKQQMYDLLSDEEHQDWSLVISKILHCKHIWLEQGFFAVAYHLIKHSDPAEDDSERELANYIHICDEFANIQVTVTDPVAQVDWLKTQITQTNKNTSKLRLSSDQSLIRIITLHKSKGLEFPVVFVPFANTAAKSIKPTMYSYHDQSNQLVMNIGFESNAFAQALSESDAENIRLLYVALTRSLYRCYLGLLVSQRSVSSALHKVMNIDLKNDESDSTKYQQAVLDAIDRVKTNAQPNIKVSQLSDVKVCAPDTNQTVVDLYASQASRRVQSHWQLNSFSKMLQASESQVLQQREEDEIQPFDEVQIKRSNENQTAELRFSLTPGAQSGNLLHDLLENTVFIQGDVASAWSKIMSKHLWFDQQHEASLFDWINQCLMAPLRPLDISLNDLNEEFLLKEAQFYFPTDKVDSRALSQFITKHRRTVSDQIGFSQVVSPSFTEQNKQNLLQGFIDLVFEHEGKFYVLDYKSSYLGQTFYDYSNENMWLNIQSHSYDLQYHIYTFAVHRLLQNRLDNYRPEKHLGGIFYLYLRGMNANDNNGQGVFFVPPDAIDISGMEALLGVKH